MGEWMSSNSRRGNRPNNWYRNYSRPPPPPPRPCPRFESENIPWEIKFYTLECRISMEQLCCCWDECASTLYKELAEWDDSGALEALNDAKSRYWAKINGLQCETPLPDRNMYTDEVDYYAAIDPELIEDLYRFPPPPAEVDDPENKGWDSSSLLSSRPIVPTGWGDEEDPVDDHGTRGKPSNWDSFIEKPIQPSGWGDDDDNPVATTAEQYNSSWHCTNWNNERISQDAWRPNELRRDGHAKVNKWAAAGKYYDGNNASRRVWHNYNDQPVRNYNRKRDRRRSYSRQTKPRQPAVDDEQANNRWPKPHGRSDDCDGADAKPSFARATQRSIPAGSCWPKNNQSSAKDDGRGSWHLERPVS